MLSAPTQRTTALTDRQVDHDKIDREVDYNKQRIKFLKEELGKAQRNLHTMHGDDYLHYVVFIEFCKRQIAFHKNKINELLTPK